MPGAVFSVLAGYLLGMAPTAELVGRRAGHDPTNEGSGNPGASNVYRTAGRRAGAIVLALDLLKGALAAGLGWLVGDHFLGLVVGAAAVAGHVLPVSRPRRGGKGVATCAGAVLVLFPLPGLVGAGVWAATTKLTRRPSIGSLVLAAGLPAAVAATGAPGREVGLLAAMALVVVARHGANIRRLAHGDEQPIEGVQR